MYQIIKRDGQIAEFDISKIANAMKKAFDATNTEYTDNVIDFLAIRVSADFLPKIKNGYVAVEDIQDSVESVLSRGGYDAVAKAYILYRKQREKLRNLKNPYLDYKETVNKYLHAIDWRVKENSTVTYSVGGLILSNSGAITANYWLSEIYDEEISNAHKNCDIHLHDLSMLTGYCAGWSLKQLIKEGLGGVPGKITSSPASHLSTLCNQMVNFLGIMQNEWAGAQAFSSFDTYLAPFVKVDHLTYKEVKQCVQSFIYGVNTPSRWGTQAPFSNITLDWTVPADLKDLPAIVGGKEMDFTYGDCTEEMKLVNKAFIDIMIEGDANGRGFQYPIPTYSITRDFDWSPTENNKLLFEMTAKYGTPYFSNYINSDMEPSDVRSMVLERTDWCISRQRRWGLPIPVFYCKDCGKPICTDKTIDAIANIFEKKGSNAWFEMEAEDMLPEGFTCPHCGKNAGFEKETDTLDGWFDSGSTHYAAMERDQGFWPATMYIEGLDQYRGWFQSSLLVAVGALGRGAPFKECLTHGWTVDGQGRAMHKSLGNGMDPAEIFNKYGADLLRLWAGSSDYHVDVRCSDDIFKQLSQNYLKFRNTAKFCLDNLTGFDPEQLVAAADMQELDRWAVTRLNSLIRRVFDSYDAYEFHAVSHAINDFCVVDLSSFYFDIIKDRLYCDGEHSASRRSAQTALFLILDAMTRMFAPILAFTCEEIWLAMPHRSADDSRSVLFNCMVQPYEDYALPQDAMDRWARIAAVRTAVNGALEQARADKTIGKSLEAEVDVTVPAEDAFLADMDADTLADLLIVSQVRVTVGDALSVTVAPAQGVKCARCWKVLTSVGTVAGHDTLCPRCAAVVKALPVVE